MRTDDPNVSTSALVGIIGAILLVVIIVALQGYFLKEQRLEVARKAAGRPVAELSALRTKQLERLGGYRWVDRSKGVVAIPVDRAMELVVRQWQQDHEALPR